MYTDADHWVSCRHSDGIDLLEVQGKHTAPARLAFYIHATIIGFQNSVYNGKSQTGAVGFGREKGIEDGSYRVFIHATPIIGNRHHDAIIFFILHRYRYSALAIDRFGSV